ncbi:hypothetical protein GCM10023189_00930 [Nibrella saemangeumensis]|uniref:Uncharacterized protein n=1 Tax=Nibrella saemangeumensis TaxID=1084526 RepID=A0ABP8MA48_9BACT
MNIIQGSCLIKFVLDVTGTYYVAEEPNLNCPQVPSRVRIEDKRDIYSGKHSLFLKEWGDVSTKTCKLIPFISPLNLTGHHRLYIGQVRTDEECIRTKENIIIVLRLPNTDELRLRFFPDLELHSINQEQLVSEIIKNKLI